MRGTLYLISREENDVVLKFSGMDEYRINCTTHQEALELFDYWYHLLNASRQALVYGWQ
jgi:hypothetical protein